MRILVLKYAMMAALLGALVFPSLGQNTSESVVDEAGLNALLMDAKAAYQNKEYAKSLPYAMEAYRLGSRLSVRNAQIQASLILAKSNRLLHNNLESLEYGIRSMKLSENTAPEYHLAATLTMIQLFNDWNLSTKELEYIEYAENLKYIDAISLNIIQEMKANALVRTGNCTDAITTLEALLVKACQTSDVSTIEKHRLSLSSCYKKLGNYPNAISQQQELLKIFTSETSSAEYALIYNNIGALLSEQKDHANAIVYFEKAFAYCPTHLNLYGEILLNLSASQFKLKREQLALDNLEKGIAVASKSNDVNTLCLSLALKSQILNSLGKLSEAIGTAHQALAAAESADDLFLKGEVYGLLAALTAKSDDNVSAAEFTKLSAEQKILLQKNALQEARYNEDLNWNISNKERAIFNSIAAEQEQNILLEQELVKTRKEKEFERLNFEKGLQEAALQNEQIEREKALKELALVQSALVAEQQLRTISDLEKIKAADQLKVTELSFAKEEKEKDVQLLRKQNDLLEADQKLRDAESKRNAEQRKFEIVAALLLFILFCLSVASVVSTRKKNRKIKLINTAIQDVNEKLNTKNNEIISSIEYARNFQSMIIPSESTFKTLTSDGLLLYRPMEIVSGDIPFVIKKGNSVYVAAIDCIGHGVPAAMLTFMAYYNLEGLIDENQPKSCGEMLHCLHKKMSEAVLEKSGSTQFNSGMDISLCRIDLDQNQMEFAGANSPILLITEGGVERINGNNFSVGDTLNDHPANFENHIRRLNKKDRIYLFSDGLIHQFGGNGRQKFSLKRVSALLQDAHKKPMGEVQKIIGHELDNWQGTCDQTDDIMLIGIEI